MTFESGRGKTGGRIAAAALAGVSLLALNTALHAQPANVQPVTAQPAGAVNVSVPAGSLESGLLSLGRQANLRMLYPSNLTAGKRTAGVNGQMSPQQAVTQLLTGTGLRASFTGRNTVQVFDPSTSTAGGALPAGAIALDTIDVQGASNPNSTMTPMPAYAGGQVATGGQLGMLGNRSVMNTPFSQTNYTNKTIQDQQAQTVNEVLANDPSIIGSGMGTSSLDVEVVRGFVNTATAGGRSLNGLASMAPLSFPSTDYIERVEVLRGPSALLNGIIVQAGEGGIGGTAALVTKRAGDEPLTQLTTSYTSRSQLGAHVDVGRRYGFNGEYGVRFNGSLNGGNTPVDTQRSKFGTAALNLDYRGERIRLSADIAHQSQEFSPSLNHLFLIPYIFTGPTTIPAPPSTSTSLSPAWQSNSFKSTLGMIQGEIDILDNVTAYGAIGAQRADAELRGNADPSLLDASGRYSFNVGANRSRYDILSMQGGIRATGTTGPVAHALSLNLSHTDWTYQLAGGFDSPIVIASIYNPIFGPAPILNDPGDLKKTSEVNASSFGIADTMSFLDERIQFTVGARYQKVSNFSVYYASNTTEGNAWSPAFGLVVKPWEKISIYTSYIQGLQPGSTVGTTYANAGDVFPPYVAKQIETGVKIDWGRVMTTLAVFQIARPSTIAIPNAGGGLPTLMLSGEQMNRGIELNAYGELFDGVRLLGGITLLDARQMKTENGEFDGERAMGAPAVRTVIGTEWDTPFIRGLTLSERFTYTSNQVVNNFRPDLTIPSWTQFDIGARYIFAAPWNGKPITVRFNVDNVLDASYWKATAFGALLFRSQPRTYRLSTTFNF